MELLDLYIIGALESEDFENAQYLISSSDIAKNMLTKPDLFSPTSKIIIPIHNRF